MKHLPWDTSKIVGLLLLVVVATVMFNTALASAFLVLSVLSVITLVVLQRWNLLSRQVAILFFTVTLVYFGVTLVIHYANFYPFGGGEGDQREYHQAAVEISDDFRQGNFSLHDIKTHLQVNESASSYPVFVAVLYTLTVPDKLVGKMLSVWLVVLSALLLYFLSREFGFSEKLAFWVGISPIFYPSYLYWGGLLLRESMVVSLVLLSVLFILKMQKRFSLGLFLVFYAGLGALIHFRFYMGYVVLFTFPFFFSLLFSLEWKKKLQYGLFIILLLGFLPQLSGHGYYGVSDVRYFTKPEIITIYRESIPSARLKEIKAIQETAPLAVQISEKTSKKLGSTVTVKAEVDNPFAFVRNYFVSFSYMLLGPFPWHIRYLRQLFVLVEMIPWWIAFFFLIKGIVGSSRHWKAMVPTVVISVGILAVIALLLNNYGTYMRIRMPVFLALFALIPFAFLSSSIRKKQRSMPGIFILSLDTESAWGSFDVGSLQTYKSHFDNWRVNVRRLIALLERYEIRATWDFVGHLFLDSCAKERGILHPDVIAPQYKEFHRRWHSVDPGGDIRRDPWWYGKDVLEAVRGINPKQEIGCHTFSHVIMQDKECTREVAYSELKKCVMLAEKEGISMSTIVFPHNKIAHLDVARELGFRSYRGLERSFWKDFPKPLGRMCSFLGRMFAVTPPVYPLLELEIQEGVLEIPASSYFFSYDGFIRKLIPPSLRFLQIRKGIDSAVANNAIFHVWFHPFNLGSGEQMFRDLERVLQYVKEQRDAGCLENLTMAEVGERWRQRYDSREKGIVILSSHKPLNYFFIRKIAEHIPVKTVIYEKQGLGKQLRMVQHRARKLGVLKVLSQLLFILLHRFWLNPLSMEKIKKLVGKEALVQPSLPSKEVAEINSKDVIDTIAEANPFAVVVSGTGILRKDLLSLPIPFLNIHAGITPQYRGVHGGFWALFNKDFENIGVTVHIVDKGLDTGKILYQAKIALDPQFDTFNTIGIKQYIQGADLMIRALQDAREHRITSLEGKGKSKQWYHPTLLEYCRGMRILKHEYRKE